LSPEQCALLECSYLRYFPTEIPDAILEDYETIIEFKDLIKSAKPNKRILYRLLDTCIEKIQSKQRFQKILLIKLIRHHREDALIDRPTSDKLFVVFKSLINEVNERIAWTLSVALKGIELSPESVDWLIANYPSSVHIQNRLLRYPKPNRPITMWAYERLKKNDLEDRLSELIGLCLNFDSNFVHKDKTSLIWGIHYSKLPDQKKKALLLKHLTTDNFEGLIKLCERNNYTDVISKLYKSIMRTSR
jgi:hypothetical protein